MVNTGFEKNYIQSALNVDTEEKHNQETFSLKNSGDLFCKIVIVDGNAKQWTDENGIVYSSNTYFFHQEHRSNHSSDQYQPQHQPMSLHLNRCHSILAGRFESWLLKGRMSLRILLTVGHKHLAQEFICWRRV